MTSPLLSKTPVGRRHRPLSAANSLRASAIVTGLIGSVLLVSPRFGLSVFDASPAIHADHWLRSGGGAFLALTVVFWAAARWPASMMQRPVLLAAGIIAAVVAFFGFVAVADGTVASTFSVVVAATGGLAAWIWWLLVTDRV